MPAFVSEASVARAPAQTPGTGIRPHSGADQAASPFADLLDGCETSDAGAADPASQTGAVAPVESAPVEAVPPQNKANQPAPVITMTDGGNIADLPAELMLVIAMTDQQAVPEGEAAKPPTGVAPDATVAEEKKSDADPSSQQADTSNAADTTVTVTVDVAVAPAAPLPAVVPVPAPLPLAVENAAPSIPAVAPAVIEAKPIASPSLDALTNAPEVDTAASIGQAAETAAPLSPAGKEKTPPAEKPAAAAPTAAPEDKTKSPPVFRSASTDAEVAAPEVDVPGPKAAAPSAETAAPKAARNGVTAPDATPNTGAAQPSPEALAHSPAFTAPFVPHISANQAAQSSAPQPGPADAVPLAGLAVAIAAHAQTGKSHFEIRLDPPELGRIDVRLDVDSNGQVTSHLRVERAETLDLLRRDAPALERALQQAGLKTSDSGLQFSLRDQSFFQQNQDRDTPAMARIVVPDETLVPVETQRQYGRLAGLGSGVDIRV